jgi:hypothetical protein
MYTDLLLSGSIRVTGNRDADSRVDHGQRRLPAGREYPSLDPTSYSTNVNCQVNTVGSQGTVTITGTISGDAPSYSVTVEVLDAASRQRIGGQTF